MRTGPSRTGERNGKVLSWGTDTNDYAPLCLSHANMLDRGGTLAHCPNGHARAVHGAGRDGQCMECKRVYARSPERLARLRRNYAAKKTTKDHEGEHVG